MQADILTSSDELRPTVQDDSLEKFPQAGSAFNIGIMLFRQSSKAFVGRLGACLHAYTHAWDGCAVHCLLLACRREPVYRHPACMIAHGFAGMEHQARDKVVKACVDSQTCMLRAISYQEPGLHHCFTKVLLLEQQPCCVLSDLQLTG